MRRILIIDRDPSLAERIERALAGRFDVQFARPEEALVLVASLHFDILLCEWDLGLVSARQILDVGLRRRHRPRIWIAYDGHHDEEVARYATAFGCPLLAKPISSAALLFHVA